MDPPPELEGYAGMEALEEGQQIILELPQEGEAGSDSVIMEVVSVDGNQIHFIAPGEWVCRFRVRDFVLRLCGVVHFVLREIRPLWRRGHAQLTFVLCDEVYWEAFFINQK